MLATRMRMGAGMGKWWEVSGKTCIGAWQAIGAPSLVASYTDLSGSGNDLTVGVAPTWASGTGWTFNGTTQYLETGLGWDGDYSLIIRYANSNNTGYLLAGQDVTGITKRVGVSPERGVGPAVLYLNGETDDISPALTTGILCIAGANCYRDSSLDVTLPSTSGIVTTYKPVIGALHWYNSPHVTFYWQGDVQAVAFYSNTLTGSQVGNLTGYINAL